jgi:hypothetical protein
LHRLLSNVTARAIVCEDQLLFPGLLGILHGLCEAQLLELGLLFGGTRAAGGGVVGGDGVGAVASRDGAELKVETVWIPWAGDGGGGDNWRGQQRGRRRYGKGPARWMVVAAILGQGLNAEVRPGGRLVVAASVSNASPSFGLGTNVAVALAEAAILQATHCLDKCR